jgi:putative transcriptional regulator
MKSLQGQLLLASRRLSDPNFFHAVVLMVQHGEEGALGLVLNRPLDMTVKQACDDDLELVCQADGVLHQGGPCQGPLMALHGHRKAPTTGPGGRSEVFSGLFFSTERDELEWLLKQARPTAKFFVGYSGWEPGQLERELDGGSWLVTTTTTQQILDASDADLWAKLVTQVTMGGRIRAELIPDDPSVN